jgi:L-lysine 6-transaminase
MDLPDGETRGAVWKGCWERGLAVLNCGPRSTRFRPPLVFSREDADRTLGILREALGHLPTKGT